MLPRPVLLDTEEVLGILREIVGRAFERARLARDTALMEECIKLTVEIDKRTDQARQSEILQLAGKL